MTFKWALVTACLAFAAGCDDAATTDDDALEGDASPRVLGNQDAGATADSAVEADQGATEDPDMGATEDPDMGTTEDPDMGEIIEDPDMGEIEGPDMGEVIPPVEGAVNVARVHQFAIAPANFGGCPDISGNGAPNNAFGGLADLANGPLQEQVTDGDVNVMPVFFGLEAPGLNGTFDLSVVTADPAGPGYVVDDRSLDANGNALINFEDAEVNAGAMVAGPGDFRLNLPVGDMPIELVVSDTSILGSLTVDANGGATVDNGIISGSITQAALDQALMLVDPTIVALVPLLLQPDLPNGEYSICVQFAAQPAQLQGFPAE